MIRSRPSLCSGPCSKSLSCRLVTAVLLATQRPCPVPAPQRVCCRPHWGDQLCSPALCVDQGDLSRGAAPAGERRAGRHGHQASGGQRHPAGQARTRRVHAGSAHLTAHAMHTELSASVALACKGLLLMRHAARGWPLCRSYFAMCVSRHMAPDVDLVFVDVSCARFACWVPAGCLLGACCASAPPKRSCCCAAPTMARHAPAAA